MSSPPEASDRRSWHEELGLTGEGGEEDAYARTGVVVEGDVGIAGGGRLAAVEHDRVLHGRRPAIVQIRSRFGEAPEWTGEKHARGNRSLRRRARKAVAHVVAFQIAEEMHQIRGGGAGVFGLDLRAVA